MTNDVYISFASAPRQRLHWAAYPQCFVFAGGMELHSHPLCNSGSIHIRVESAGARGPNVFTSDSGNQNQGQHLMRCLPSEWGVLSFANMLLMGVNVLPLPVPRSRWPAVSWRGSEVKSCWFPTCTSDKDRKAGSVSVNHVKVCGCVEVRCTISLAQH